MSDTKNARRELESLRETDLKIMDWSLLLISVSHGAQKRKILRLKKNRVNFLAQLVLIFQLELRRRQRNGKKITFSGRFVTISQGKGRYLTDNHLGDFPRQLFLRLNAEIF